MDSPFKVRKTKEGANLKRWFKEKWIDTKTGKACGRSEGENRSTPYCRPSKRISSETPKTAGEMTSSEKRKKENEKKRLGNLKVNRAVLNLLNGKNEFRTRKTLRN